MLVVKIKDYAYLVPFIEDKEGKFLKTIILSRGAPRASPWHHLVSPIRFANGGT